MKIELKNVKFSEALSEETNAFTADVFIDGKKCGYAKNSGRGGCTDVHAYPEKRFEFQEAEKWLKNQPQLNIGGEAKPYMIDCDMEATVDYLLEKWLQEKEDKKIQNRCKTNVVCKTNNGYTLHGWKNTTITGMLNNPVLTARLEKVVRDFVKEGKTIVNKNLPEDWLK